MTQRLIRYWRIAISNCKRFCFLLVNLYAKKGDNLATKEDIEEITQLTEEIKNDLQLSNENKLGFQPLRRNAVVEYYESYCEWLNCLLFVEFENVKVEEIKPKLEHLLSAYTNAESRLRLLDQKFIKYEPLTITISFAVMT